MEIYFRSFFSYNYRFYFGAWFSRSEPLIWRLFLPFNKVPDDNDDYDDSGTDISDCETESTVSAIVSQVSSISLEAVCDSAIDPNDTQIPLLRKAPFPDFNTTIRFVYPDTSKKIE